MCVRDIGDVSSPKWALRLAEKIANDYGISVDLEWKTRDGRSSSGAAYDSGRIIVRAGRDKRDAKHTLIHEIAHVIASGDCHHNKQYWMIAWKLYENYDRKNLVYNYLESAHRRRSISWNAIKTFNEYFGITIEKLRAGKRIKRKKEV